MRILYLGDKSAFVQQLISGPFGEETKFLADKRNLTRPSPYHRRGSTIGNEFLVFLSQSQKGQWQETHHKRALKTLFHKHQIFLLERFRQSNETRPIFRHGQ